MPKRAKGYARRCYDGDAKRRRASNWPTISFVAPEFQKPQDPTEQAALEAVLKFFGPNVFTVHVYDVVELVAKVLRKEKE